MRAFSSGFGKWASPCEVVDLSEVKVSRGPEHGPSPPPVLAMSLGIIPSGIICRDRLWDLAEPLQASARHRCRDLWQRLRSEDAPLRVIEGGKLVSAPISFFDARLMSYVTNDWLKVARIVGEALAAEMDDEVLQVGDIVLAARIDALAESGRLEMQGKSALEMHGCLVRRPQ